MLELNANMLADNLLNRKFLLGVNIQRWPEIELKELDRYVYHRTILFIMAADPAHVDVDRVAHACHCIVRLFYAYSASYDVGPQD